MKTPSVVLLVPILLAACTSSPVQKLEARATGEPRPAKEKTKMPWKPGESSPSLNFWTPRYSESEITSRTWKDNEGYVMECRDYQRVTVDWRPDLFIAKYARKGSKEIRCLDIYSDLEFLGRPMMLIYHQSDRGILDELGFKTEGTHTRVTIGWLWPASPQPGRGVRVRDFEYTNEPSLINASQGDFFSPRER